MSTRVGSQPLRTRIATVLNHPLAIVIELIVIVGIFLVCELSDTLPATIPLVVLGTVSLIVRGIGWGGVGLRRPDNWGRTFAIGLGAGLLLTVLIDVIGDPLIARITSEPLDLSGFGEIQGNLGNMLFLIVLSWLLAAFGEEMSYRGYWLNRAADLFGGTRAGWIFALVLVTACFGVAHLGQGLTGVISSTLAGLAYAAVYLSTGRNLSAAILTHGISNTATILLIFFNLFPALW
jgi:hypothetical protein